MFHGLLCRAEGWVLTFPVSHTKEDLSQLQQPCTDCFQGQSRSGKWRQGARYQQEQASQPGARQWGWGQAPLQCSADIRMPPNISHNPTASSLWVQRGFPPPWGDRGETSPVSATSHSCQSLDLACIPSCSTQHFRSNHCDVPNFLCTDANVHVWYRERETPTTNRR